MIKRKEYQLLYLIPAFIGFLTYGTFGLFSSPFAFWIISWISKIKFNDYFNTSASRWTLWLLLGVALIPWKQNYRYKPSINIFGDVIHPAPSSIKLQLVNGIKECVVREGDGLSTNFYDVSSFNKTHPIYKIERHKTSKNSNTCFASIAIQHKKKYLNFFDLFPLKELPNYATLKIDLDNNTGRALRTCNYISKYDGCNAGNTW